MAVVDLRDLQRFEGLQEILALRGSKLGSSAACSFSQGENTISCPFQPQTLLSLTRICGIPTVRDLIECSSMRIARTMKTLEKDAPEFPGGEDVVIKSLLE